MKPPLFHLIDFGHIRGTYVHACFFISIDVDLK